MRVLRVGGRLLTCGATAGYDPPEDIRFIWTFELEILGSNGWAREDITALLGNGARAVGWKWWSTRPSRWSARPRRSRASRQRQVFGKLVMTP